MNTPQQGQQGNPHKEQAVSLGAMDDRPQLPKFGLRMCFQTSQVQRISISPKVIHPVKMLEFPLTNQRPSANPDSLTVQPFFWLKSLCEPPLESPPKKDLAERGRLLKRESITKDSKRSPLGPHKNGEGVTQIMAVFLHFSRFLEGPGNV